MKFTEENVALSALAHRMNLVRWRWIRDVPAPERKDQQKLAQKASKAGKAYLAKTSGEKIGGETYGTIPLPQWRNSPESLFKKTEEGYFIVPRETLAWIPGQAEEAERTYLKGGGNG